MTAAVSTTNAEEATATDAPAEGEGEGETKGEDEVAEDGPAADPTVFADASNFSLKHPLYSKVSEHKGGRGAVPGWVIAADGRSGQERKGGTDS